MRKSFIIHFDSLDVLDELTDEQAGQLFRGMASYQKTGDCGLSGMMKAIFIPFKNQFDRDNEKYESICERNKINGLKGGRPKPKETQKTQSVILGTQNNPKEPDNKSDSKNKSKNDNKKDSSPIWFEGDVIRLNERDYKTWESMTGFTEDYFFKILSERDNWLADNPDKSNNWFMSTSSWLKKISAQAAE